MSGKKLLVGIEVPRLMCVVSEGVNLENIDTCFKAGIAAVGIGSDLTKGSPEEMEEKVRQYVAKVKNFFG